MKKFTVSLTFLHKLLTAQQHLKNFLLLLFISFPTIACFSQLEASFKKDNDTITVTRKKDVDQIIHLPVTIEGVSANSSNNDNSITFMIDVAQSAPGVSMLTPSPLIIKVNSGVTEVDCPITIFRGQNSGNTPLFITLQMAYNNSALIKTKKIVLNIINEEVKDNTASDEASFFSKITFLNAYNFDFNGKLSSNYVGKFNVYQPSDKILHFGVNAGIMKINYGVDDSTSADSYRKENVFIHPLDTIKAGEKYLIQYNKYATKVKNTAWSLYLEPLLRINSSSNTKIYLHGHLELLVNKFSVTTTISNVQQDTGIFSATPVRSLVVRSNLQNESTSTTTLLNGYFGLGTTFDISLAKNSSLFIQGTLGATTNYPQPASAPSSDNNSNGIYNRVIGYYSWNSFYLVRVYYNQQVSDAAKVVIATDIRGLLPKYNPLYAVYIGLNLKLESLVETITGKK